MICYRFDTSRWSIPSRMVGIYLENMLKEDSGATIPSEDLDLFKQIQEDIFDRMLFHFGDESIPPQRVLKYTEDLSHNEFLGLMADRGFQHPSSPQQNYSAEHTKSLIAHHKSTLSDIISSQKLNSSKRASELVCYLKNFSLAVKPYRPGY